MRALLTAAVGLIAGPVALVAAAVGVGLLAAGQSAQHASSAATDDIPPVLLGLYQDAADQRCPELPWTVLAAIGKVESNHARNAGAQLSADGRVEPLIIGPPLNGGPGVRAIPDTDGGRWDGDTTWDRAVGPMQFIPSTWRRHGVDASGTGEADPHHAADAIHTAAAYLCYSAEGSWTLREVVYRYNQADWYVTEVLEIASRYAAQPVLVAGQPVAGGYALPVDRVQLTPALLDRPHHDYPAWDLALPRGTPVAAVHAGQVLSTPSGGRCGRGVVIAGDDGARYTYCHASRVLVTTGQRVQAGHHLLDSGNTGNSSGPHLHLDIRADGVLVCPQPLLAAWFAGHVASPSQAPTEGCST